MGVVTAGRSLSARPRRPSGRVFPAACALLFGLAVLFVRPDGAAEGAPQDDTREEVWWVPIPPDEEFPDAVAPNALRLACASTPDLLAAEFRRQRLPYHAALLRRSEARSCHVWYEPTLRGFRADPDDYPIAELFTNFNVMNFLSLRENSFGDAIDIVKSVVEQADSPPRLSISIAKGHPDSLHERALSFHFGDRRFSVRLIDGGAEGANPWAQDYLKSGHVGPDSRILITRRLYEGDAAYATHYTSLLDSFDDSRFVRSRLAWEGGDLQFVLHPRDPSRLLVFYGNSARPYWGRYLTPEEYAYVLKVEFGADEAVEVGDLAAHVDYFVSFIPQARVALVSQPVLGSHAVATSAVELLRRTFGDGSHLELLDLATALEFPARLFRERRYEVKAALWNAYCHSDVWPRQVDPVLRGRILDYVAESCPDNPPDCFSAEGQLKLLDTRVELLRDWMSAALEDQDRRRLAAALLPALESQLPGFRPRNARKFEEKVEEIRKLGFRVIRVPRIPGDPELEVPWAGISYVNMLVVGEQLFVPTFGLGPPEERFLEELQGELPPPYRVVPVYARHLLLNNGGVHCTVGIVRSLPENPPAAD
jgi:hypothetical protein